MKYLSRFTAVLAVAAIAIPVWAQDIPMTRPDKVGMSQERLDRITERMERNIEQGLTAGEVALVARHGKVAYFESRGTSDREARRPMTEDTIFRIYSMSKPITSVGLMLLYE